MLNPLKKINKLPIEVATKLASNTMIIKLLVNDKMSAMTDPAPSETVNELIKNGKICFHRAVAEEINDNNDNNTNLLIYIDNVTRADQNKVDVSLFIYAITNNQHVMLNNNRLRLLELSNYIISTLDEEKFSPTGKLHFEDMEYSVLTPFKFCYIMRFDLQDDIEGLVEL